jgi:hypothetical protein
MRLSNEIRGLLIVTQQRLLFLKSPIYVVFALSCLIVIEKGVFGIVSNGYKDKYVFIQRRYKLVPMDEV